MFLLYIINLGKKVNLHTVCISNNFILIFYLFLTNMVKIIVKVKDLWSKLRMR